MAELKSDGNTSEFDQSWRSRSEARYNHWTGTNPANQIQLAFRSHWTLFNEILGDRSGLCVEVGCGRGSISSYFAEHGWQTVLLDYSNDVLETAKAIFRSNGHRAMSVRGDARRLPLRDSIADVVVSIGLLEHFEDTRQVLAEQVRVLAPGGVLLVYVVPEYRANIQRRFRWVNGLLGWLHRPSAAAAPQKQTLFRSDVDSEHYTTVLAELGLAKVESSGVYPLPMISHSPEFPFSLMHPILERLLTGCFRIVLVIRRLWFRRNPWLCREGLGQAFLVTGQKPED